MTIMDKKVDYLVVDTTAFIENAPLQNIAQNVVTVQEVVNEITSKRQLRRLVVLPYDLIIKEVFPENIRIVTEFAQKTGDYPNLSATDIKVMALTYQLEKAEVGTEHIRKEPLVRRTVNIVSKPQEEIPNPDISGFFMPKHKDGNVSRPISESENDHQNVPNELNNEFELLNLQDNLGELSKSKDNSDVLHVSEDNSNALPHLNQSILSEVKDNQQVLLDSECNTDTPTKPKQSLDDLILPQHSELDSSSDKSDCDGSDDEDGGWITPSNVHEAKKQIHSDNLEEKCVKVACITTDFAMQNVLKQMNLHVSALDGRIIKQLKTYILRCYSCFKTTSIMTKKFCSNCGNATLKRVSVSVDSDGKQKLHINARRPLTSRGKKFSLPTVHGGKHSNNPVLSADQPMPDQRPTRLARTKNNPLSDDYIAGFSPFVMRDVNSKSAQLGIRTAKEVKHWMRKNPNEAHKKRK